jgi:hypothetical protein
MTYKIVRFYFNGQRRVIKRNLSLDEAQNHCNDPETSSFSCKRKRNIRRTEQFGLWFDGYETE